MNLSKLVEDWFLSIGCFKIDCGDNSLACTLFYILCCNSGVLTLNCLDCLKIILGRLITTCFDLFICCFPFCSCYELLSLNFMSWVAKSLVTLQILIGVYKEDMNSSNLTSPNYNYQKEKKKMFWVWWVYSECDCVVIRCKWCLIFIWSLL